MIGGAAGSLTSLQQPLFLGRSVSGNRLRIAFLLLGAGPYKGKREDMAPRVMNPELFI